MKTRDNLSNYYGSEICYTFFGDAVKYDENRCVLMSVEHWRPGRDGVERANRLEPETYACLRQDAQSLANRRLFQDWPCRRGCPSSNGRRPRPSPQKQASYDLVRVSTERRCPKRSPFWVAPLKKSVSRWSRQRSTEKFVLAEELPRQEGKPFSAQSCFAEEQSEDPKLEMIWLTSGADEAVTPVHHAR